MEKILSTLESYFQNRRIEELFKILILVIFLTILDNNNLKMTGNDSKLVGNNENSQFKNQSSPWTSTVVFF